MPRVSSNSSDDTPKRAPRRRVAKPKAEAKASAPVSRKAPTSVSSTGTASPKKSKKGIYITLTLLAVVLGAAVMIGYSDDGQIDINTVISERNARVGSGDVRDGESTEIIPVQNTSNLPDGGLQLQSPGPQPVTPPPVEEDVSTTTATSSEEVNEEDVAVETEDEEVPGEAEAGNGALEEGSQPVSN